MERSIGEVAQIFGVSSQTLRQWEAQKLIPPAKRKFIARWRVWTDEDIKTIEQVVKSRSKE